jgi:intein/homing endonuclease
LKLRLASDFAIDTDLYKREGLRFSILAMSGHGKSNAAADLVEDVLDQHGQVIIIEPIPEWHCVTPETPILLGNGEVVPAGDLEKRLAKGPVRVVSYGNSGFKAAPLVQVTREKTTELIKIEARMGRKLSGTPNHKVAILKKHAVSWVRLDEIRVGDRLLIPRKFPKPFHPKSQLPLLQNLKDSKGVVINEYLYWNPHHGNKPKCKIQSHLTPQLCEWLGYFLADGHLSKDLYKVMFIEGDEERRRRFAQLTRELFDVEGIDSPDKWAYTVSNKALGIFLKRVLRLQSGRKATTLRIPKVIMRADNSLLGPFIKAYAECDGSGRTIATYSKWAAIQLCYLAERAGYHASLNETKVSNPHFIVEKKRTHFISARQPTWYRVLLVKGSHLSYKHAFRSNFDSVKITSVQKVTGNFEVIGTLVPKTHNLVCGETPIVSHNTLKARFNRVVVIGGPYQDLPLEAEFAHEYVLAALEKGMSLVVNVSDIEEDVDQIKFVSRFLWNLYRLEQKYRRVLFLVLEEADIWAPQQWDAITKQSLSRVSLIAKHGRKIGIFPILISQRPADLHKSPLSQCNINLFGKFTSPADLDPKTGLMFAVKKQHLNISEEQIMNLPTGSFIVSHKGGVTTVAVRKRLCPHGADTPLIEAKPFTHDVSQALGGLREEIQKAVDAKKTEDSAIKRLEKENEALHRLNEELKEKTKIKLSVKEMMSSGYRSIGEDDPDLEPRIRKLTQENLSSEIENKRLTTIIEGRDKQIAELLNKQKENLAAQKIADGLKELFPILPPANCVESNGTVGLQKVMTFIDVTSSEKFVTINTESMRGKILAVAQKGKLETWRRLDDIVKAVEEERWSATPQEVNNALNDLEKQGLIAKKHTDRNYYCLAQNVKITRGS